MVQDNDKGRRIRVYYFSVEGHTEKWYLQWLERTINSRLEKKFMVRFRIRVHNDPWARAASVKSARPVTIYQLCDMESDDPSHMKRFHQVLARMRAAEAAFPDITYELAYCNYTFELWILLHRTDAFARMRSRKDYLALIRNVYGETYQGSGQYKSEKGFGRLLRKLHLRDVQAAVSRARRIECNNTRLQTPEEYAGYTFFPQNPSLSLGACIGHILNDCGITL